MRRNLRRPPPLQDGDEEDVDADAVLPGGSSSLSLSSSSSSSSLESTGSMRDEARARAQAQDSGLGRLVQAGPTFLSSSSSHAIDSYDERRHTTAPSHPTSIFSLPSAVGREGEVVRHAHHHRRRHASTTLIQHHTLPFQDDAAGRDRASSTASYPISASASASGYHPLASINSSINLTESLRSVLYPTSPASASPSVSGSATAESGRSAASSLSQTEVPPSVTMAAVEGTLPEDDGFRSLRRKLQEIKLLALSTEEKAKRMHALMTEDYMTRNGLIDSSQAPASQHAGLDSQNPRASALGPAAAMPIDPNNPWNLGPKDLEPTFSPLPVNPHDVGADFNDAIVDDIPDLGCMHYKRNVKIQCFDCQRWFPCRHCHDQATDLAFPHSLNRKKTQHMLCMFCSTPQPATEQCAHCGEYAAYYFCPKCKLWDNDVNKRIYHCDDCGICRVGEGLGRDFVHCRRCNVCISISTSASHPCIERATEGNCPLCLVHLFESRTPVVSLPCGHYMHGECYKDLMAVTYKCPVCSKSAVNMELQWKKLDAEIQAQPMPEEESDDLRGVLPHVEGAGDLQQTNAAATEPAHTRRPTDVWVGCNDCGRRSWTPFHWLGLKCQRCDSYNTNQLAPTTGQETDAERLMRQQQTHRQHDFTGDAVLRDAGIGVEEEVRQVNSNLDMPKSPAHQPASPTSPTFPTTSAHSPRRYFMQEEESRRRSFTAPRFSTPSMPNLPTLADMPRMPRMPNLSNLPNLPNLPNMPNLPNFPNMRSMPQLPNMRPNLPHMPNIDFPRLSAYDMFNAVSRSLSPMRYYLQGFEGGIDDIGSRHHGILPRPPSSARSDPEVHVSGGGSVAEGASKRRKDKVRSVSESSAADESLGLFDSDSDADEDDEDDEDEDEDDEGGESEDDGVCLQDLPGTVVCEEEYEDDEDEEEESEAEMLGDADDDDNDDNDDDIDKHGIGHGKRRIRPDLEIFGHM